MLDVSLIHALARTHLWLKALSKGTYQSIEELAATAKWNPKLSEKYCGSHSWLQT